MFKASIFDEFKEKVERGDKELNLWRKGSSSFSFLLFSFHPHFLIADNRIGDEGCKALAELLKTNTSVTKLSLSVTDEWHPMLYFTFTFQQQTMELDMKGAKHLLNYWRQILHLLNLIFHWYDIVNTYFFISLKMWPIELEMKGARHLLNYWRQIPHLLNLTFRWYDIVNKRFSISKYSILSMELDMKGARHLLNYWRQIPHLLNLIFQWYDIVNKPFSFPHFLNFRQSNWRWRVQSTRWTIEDKYLTY